MYGLFSQPELGVAIQRLGYEPITPYDFYRSIFGDNLLDQIRDSDELKALKEHNRARVGGYVGILLYVLSNKDGKRAERRTVTDDLDIIKEVEHRSQNEYSLCLMSPISYVGRARSSDNARLLHALVVEIDHLKVEGEKQTGLLNLIRQWETGFIPKPTYCVASGTGIHLYYLFEKPINLYKDVSRSLAHYKHQLTKKLWNRNVTYSYKPGTIQFESLFQGFRVVGSRTKLGDGEVATAYITGEKVSIEYMNSFVAEKDRFVAEYSRKLTLTQAKEKYPEWYERRIVEKEKPGKWVCNKALYDWWLKKISEEATIGHRYYCMMILCIYALKCNTKRQVLVDDCKILKDRFNLLTVNPEDEFTENDMLDALKAYSDKSLVTYPINSIIYRSGLEITKNKRNGRKQKDHLLMARKIKEVKKLIGAEVKEGRPNKKNEIEKWRKNNPKGTKAACIKDTGISKPTVYKWWK